MITLLILDTKDTSIFFIICCTFYIFKIFDNIKNDIILTFKSLRAVLSLHC